jgi:hypothetical protein
MAERELVIITHYNCVIWEIYRGMDKIKYIQILD